MAKTKATKRARAKPAKSAKAPKTKKAKPAKTQPAKAKPAKTKPAKAPKPTHVWSQEFVHGKRTGNSACITINLNQRAVVGEWREQIEGEAEPYSSYQLERFKDQKEMCSVYTAMVAKLAKEGFRDQDGNSKAKDMTKDLGEIFGAKRSHIAQTLYTNDGAQLIQLEIDHPTLTIEIERAPGKPKFETRTFKTLDQLDAAYRTLVAEACDAGYRDHNGRNVTAMTLDLKSMFGA